MENYLIPDVLKMISGEKVINKFEWEQFRREEIIGLLSWNIFGYNIFPIDKITFEIKHSIKNCECLINQINIKTIVGDIPIKLYIPNGNKPVKTIVYLRLSDQNENDIPLSYILKRGYAVILLWVENVASDNMNTFKTGIFKKFTNYLNDNSCGTIGAWSYALSRVMDYVELDNRLLNDSCILAGFSRGGKCCLWTAAVDTRFSMCAALHSGCMGAQLSRDVKPDYETIQHIIDNFPYWFCKSFVKYGNNEKFLSVDQHMLLALIAPRNIFISSAYNDIWSDPSSEINSSLLASSVYKLYGLEGIHITQSNNDELICIDGEIGCYIGNGIHEVETVEWKYLLDFADNKLK